MNFCSTGPRLHDVNIATYCRSPMSMDIGTYCRSSFDLSVTAFCHLRSAELQERFEKCVVDFRSSGDLTLGTRSEHVPLIHSYVLCHAGIRYGNVDRFNNWLISSKASQLRNQIRNMV
jgi:hypothetical protein